MQCSITEIEAGGMAAQKAAGDAAFRAGELERALEHYSAALEGDPLHVPTLCNRSLTALKLGLPEAALQDAEAALHALAPGSFSLGYGLQQQHLQQQRLAKAVHRKAEALAALGQLLDAIRTYRQGLAACPGSAELHAALRMATEELPESWLAKYWGGHVESAQAPHPLSSRDGRLIKPVPAEQRLAPPDLQAHLQAALYDLGDEARDLLCAAWARGRRPGKAEAAYMRGAAYLNAGNAQQAIKDARFALAYGPQLEAACTALVPAGGKEGAAAGGPPAPPPAAEVGRTSAWPAALALLSGALEAVADNVYAALAAQRALELDPENGSYAEAVARLLRRIPEPCAAALQAGGAAGLEAHLAAEKEQATPEYRRNRPKYYYYYEWMKKRIGAQYPALPEPVMDKLLALEANELDMVLQYPAATRMTVERLLGVYQGQGADALESYSVPLLSWEDLQTIREGDGTDVPALPPAQQQEVRRLEAGGSAAPAAQAGEESQKQDGGGGDASATGVLPAAEAAAAATHDASATAAGGMHGAHTVEAAPANDDDAASCSLDGGSDGAASEADSIDLEDLYALD
ncbi:Tetratricopeptide repeat [Micractinium conductrix]|uniref:Tetratricopeptide repeat n=1 Tax=Micractinium conductrix TaxID=554055 RepID=A0A2P6V9Z4_9CHLO|nr:Tetratricopeptide repeat [Micractinium conductrix]|eukprot:PSC70912.1 Tetratricopeptide repeat [Micractinium conductrix]